MKAKEAYDFLIELSNNKNHTINPASKPFTLPDNHHDNLLSKYTVDNDTEKVHKGNIETLSQAMEQCIIIRKHKEGGEIKEQKFGKEFKDKGKDPIIIDLSPYNKEHKGHYAVPEEMNITVKLTGANNCFYDDVAAQLHDRGDYISVQELRELAEQPSLNNFYYDILNKLSGLLKNPLTREIYIETKSALLVGGDHKKHTKNYQLNEYD
jgi:hypothetical protein